MSEIVRGLVIVLSILQIKGGRGPEGCEDGWVHFRNFCYYFADGRVHFDSAKAICSLKKASLVSLWKPDEFDFVQNNLKQFGTSDAWAWIGAIPTKNNKWMWMDGSFFDMSNPVPPASAEMCGSISQTGDLHFLDCDETVPAFICKKPLDMLYVPSSINITDDIVQLNDDESATIFERLWPPSLDLISLDDSHKHNLATVDVSQETDCAYRCYTIGECKAFLVACKAARKCNVFRCTLLSSVQHFGLN